MQEAISGATATIIYGLRMSLKFSRSTKAMQNRAQIGEINFLFVFFVSFYLSAVCVCSVHHNFWESFTPPYY